MKRVRTPFKRSMSLLLALGTLCAGGSAYGAPAYKEARAIYDELARPVAQTPMWSRKPLPERVEALREADQLIARAEKAFGSSPVGDGAACRNAAISRKFYIIAMNDLALILEGRPISGPHDLYAPMSVSVGFGEHKANCSAYVDGLKK